MRKQRHDLRAAEACPVEVALDIMGGEWKAVMLCRLSGGALRFSSCSARFARSRHGHGRSSFVSSKPMDR